MVDAMSMETDQLLFLFLIIMNGIFLLTVIAGFYGMIAEYNKVPLKPPLLGFYAVISFVFCTLLCSICLFVSSSINLKFIVYDGNVIDYIEFMDINQLILDILYPTQNYLLLITLFSRIYFVFTGSIMELSKISTICFISIFFMIPIYHSIYYSKYNILPCIIGTGISYGFTILLTLTLIIIFIYKLFHIFKHCEHARMIAVVSKLSLLGTISIIITILTSITVIIGYISSDIPYIHIITMYMISMDVYSNFLLIVLSYNIFDKYYKKLCNKLNIQCAFIVSCILLPDKQPALQRRKAISSNTVKMEINKLAIKLEEINRNTPEPSPDSEVTKTPQVLLSNAMDIDDNNGNNKYSFHSHEQHSYPYHSLVLHLKSSIEKPMKASPSKLDQIPDDEILGVSLTDNTDNAQNADITESADNTLNADNGDMSESSQIYCDYK